MHAWESIQKAVDYIENHLESHIPIETLAETSHLSLFYFQRLFARLVKKPVGEYIKLRRLAHGAVQLAGGSTPVVDIAMACGFSGRETFSRAFKEAYGLSPGAYKRAPASLNHFDKPNLLLNYVTVGEGVPLIAQGIVLEYHRKTLAQPVHFLGVQDLWQFRPGKMLGERPGVSEPAALWDRFHKIRSQIPSIPHGRQVGVSYPGDAPEGYSTYFVGAEANPSVPEGAFARWVLPAREYIVCQYEAEDFQQLMASLGSMMKFTRHWLKAHGLKADVFFPEIYGGHMRHTNHAYMEMWIPFKERENNKKMEALQ